MSMYPSDHLLPELHRCIDCALCDPLNLIGQTAICRRKRTLGWRDFKIYEGPYIMIRCKWFSDIIRETEGPSHQGVPQGCDGLGGSGDDEGKTPRP